MPEGIIAGVLAGVAGGVIGGFVGGSLRTPDGRAPAGAWMGAAPLAAAVLVGLFAYAAPMNAGPPTRAQFTLEDVTPRPSAP